jgi:hypothetical protein
VQDHGGGDPRQKLRARPRLPAAEVRAR